MQINYYLFCNIAHVAIMYENKWIINKTTFCYIQQ